MQRMSFALLLPLTVMPLVVAIALFVGWTLHQFSKDAAVGIALLLTVGITAAGFIFDRSSPG